MRNPFRRKQKRVQITEPVTGLKAEYVALRVRKNEPNHVRLLTEKGEVDIRTVNPMDTIVEDI